jgi:hypothetical protein
VRADNGAGEKKFREWNTRNETALATPSRETWMAGTTVRP